MKTIVKTSVKGNENLTVKESVDEIFEMLSTKHSFIIINQIGHDGKSIKLGIKKTAIRMFKES